MGQSAASGAGVSSDVGLAESGGEGRAAAAATARLAESSGECSESNARGVSVVLVTCAGESERGIFGASGEGGDGAADRRGSEADVRAAGVL